MHNFKGQREGEKARKAEKKKLRNLKAYISDNPYSAIGYDGLGVFYGERGKYEQALEQFNQAIRLDNKGANIYNNRGTLYQRMELYEEALKDFNKAIKLNNKDADFYYNRGTVYGLKKSYQKALEDFNKAIELNGKDPNFYYNRATLYQKQKLYEKAFEDYNRSIELNPTSEAHANRAIVNAELKKFVEAEQDFNKAAELEPRQEYFFKQSLTIYLLKNALEKANHNQQQLVREYNHSVGNHLFPERLYRIANTLKQHCPKLTREYFELLDAADEEQQMRINSQLLRLRHLYSNNPQHQNEQFRRLVASDRDAQPPCSSFQDILNDSLKVAVRDFFQHTTLMYKRAAYATEHNLNLTELENHYQQQVLLAEQPALEWIQQHLITDFQVNISPAWTEIKLKQLNYAEAVLRNILFELLFNLFKYSDLQHVQLDFSDTTEQDTKYLVVQFQNSYQDNTSIGSQMGLDALREQLQQLNNDVDSLEITQDSQQFTLCFKLEKIIWIYPQSEKDKDKQLVEELNKRRRQRKQAQ